MVDLSLSESNDIDSIPVSYEAFCGFIWGHLLKIASASECLALWD